MAGEANGRQEAQEQGQTQGGQGQQQEAQRQEPTVPAAGSCVEGAGTGGGDTSGDDTSDGGVAGGTVDYAAQIAERNRRIAELTVQVSAAAESAERAEKLSAEIAAVRERAESDRIEYQLSLAGARNVKAARALLADHGGDVDKLKEAEPWLFAAGGGKGAAAAGSGSTGLPNAGTANSGDAQLRHFLDVAGVADEGKKE